MKNNLTKQLALFRNFAKYLSATLSERAQFCEALGHPVRLAIADKLARGERCGCELLELPALSKLSGASVSQHLLVLKTTGIIADARRGKKIFYRLQMPWVTRISLCVAERLESSAG